MAIEDKEKFYDKCFTLKIKAFETRIDKSKAFGKRFPSRQFNGLRSATATTITKSNKRDDLDELMNQHHLRQSSIYTISPYFVDPSNNNRIGNESKQQKPLFSSLSQHEAKVYGYKLAQSSELLKSNSNYCYQTAEYLTFSTTATTGSSSCNNNNDSQSRKREITKLSGRKVSSTLREELNRKVLKTTRIAMTNACKQYPSLPSRNVLDKYAHLFGLKPVR